ncbi:glycoside hydrolase [Dichotomopilus funicola]|uniref:non-reducing end alpha-L-arabinofuranosidase n=1 Tax=Dichotomopilus funicola TaxID=1934379 RepID=A0AAN6V584_9PEZI|nr:glycoside hydrolase [Dichotomopilus funicola]
MATFTRIAEDETPTITIDPSHTVADIEDNIYGGFTEHMGRCIYGGIYDPGNPLSDANGFRTDVIDAMKELNVPVVRYPGGNFVATYNWLDGVGPKEKRPSRPELAWIGVERNEFGTDEFMKWCEVVGTEPYLCLNMGTGTLREALGWLEYCNSDRDTYYANLRRQNGREKPYNVKYWALGNECYGPWQVEQLTKEAYATKAYQWAKALKLLDPSITLILCGESGFSSWDHHVLQHCLRPDMHALGGTKSLIDMHSIHLYTADGTAHLPNATAPRAAERAIQMTSALIDLARIENRVPPTVPKPKICFDEWNVWDPSRAPGEQGAEEKYTLSDALAVAVWLNVFVRQAGEIGMANIAQSVNVISPLLTSPNGLVKQTTWWPLLLFSRYMRGQTIALHVRGQEYTGPTKPTWLRGTGMETPFLDCSAVKGSDGWVNLAVVNVDEERDYGVVLEGLVGGGKVQVFVVTGENVSVTNTDGKENVGVVESEWDGKGRFTFARHSFTLLRWKESV